MFLLFLDLDYYEPKLESVEGNGKSLQHDKKHELPFMYFVKNYGNF